MAMKIPGGNPFEVGVSTYPVEGLVTPKADVSHAKAKYSAFQEQVDKWNAEQDAMAANDLINELEKESELMKNDPNEGWANQMGKNAVQRESGKSLADEQIERFKTKYHGMNLGMYSPAVRKKVQAYYDTKVNYINRDVNRHVIRQNEVWRESVDEENFRNLTKQALSQDPEEARSGFAGIRVLTDQRAARAGIKADYTKTLGPVLGMRITDALEAKNFAEAEQILAASEEYMDPMQFRKFGRAVKKAKEAGALDMMTSGAAIQLEQEWSEESLAKSIFEETTGAKFDEKEFQSALIDSDGDTQAALQAIGARYYESNNEGLSADDAQERAISMGKTLEAKVKNARNASVKDVADWMMEKYPGMPVEQAFAASRKFVAARSAKQHKEQMDRDEQASVLFKSIRGGARYEDIPDASKDKLPKSVLESFKTLSHRQATNTLCDDSALVYRLRTNPTELKNLTEEEFLSYAPRMTAQTFDKLNSFRQELLANKRPTDPKFKLGPMIKKGMEFNNIKVGSGTPDKIMAGLIFEVIEDALELESFDAGRALTQAEVNEKIAQFAAETFEFPDDWGMDDSYSFASIMKGQMVDMDSDVEALLNAGLTAQGIYEHNDINRTRSFAYIAIMPDRPIEGAEQMMAYLSANNEPIFKKTANDFAKKGFASLKDVDPSEFIRYALINMSAYKRKDKES